MNIPNELHQILLAEMKDATERMAAASNANDKLYYFSATFGHINRIMNYHCDPMLVLAHQVLQVLHQQLQARVANAMQMPSESTAVPDSMFERLQGIANESLNAISIQSEPALVDVLKSAAVLSYATSGNGYYLLLQGKLQLT
jgi:hypothetical protein